MTRDEAISLLQRGIVGEIYDEKGYLTALGYEALEAIDSSKCPTLVPKKNGEWILVSDRLPEEKGKYLCTTHYAIPPYHVFHPENDIYVDSVSVHNFDGKSFIDSVVAWMPLPEPYKGEGDEK